MKLSEQQDKECCPECGQGLSYSELQKEFVCTNTLCAERGYRPKRCPKCNSPRVFLNGFYTCFCVANKSYKLDRIVTLLEEIKDRLSPNPIMAPQMQSFTTPSYPTQNPGNIPNSTGSWSRFLPLGGQFIQTESGSHYPTPTDTGPRCPGCGLIMNKVSEGLFLCGWPGCSDYKLPNFNQTKPE